MVNGIVSLISLSDFSLLVYRNTKEFCVLILYPVTLIFSLVSTSNFLVESLGFLYKKHAMCKSSFPIWITFISFYSLITVAKTSKIMLNNSGNSGHPCLVPALTGNAFSFSPLRIMLAVGLLCCAC